jgi:hypothetical protein
MDGLFSLLLFAGLFFLMMRFGCGSHIAHGGHGHHTPADKPDSPAGGAYTCPMHPEVRQPSPGACPKCGMKLEPESTRKGEQS